MSDPAGPGARKSSAPSEGYRPCVGVMLVNRDGLVFVGRRIDLVREVWQMPQGGIDEGETPAAAAMRELEEETGTAQARIFAESEGWYDYDIPPDLLGRRWRGRYRGQSQKWFAAHFEGDDADIRLDTEHPEFCDWRWVEIETLEGLIIAFKREVYRAVVAELGPKISAALN